MLTPTAPAGYRNSGHEGILVPAHLMRKREVWSADERKVMDRAAKLALLHGIKLTLTCIREGCKGALARTADEAGQDVLRCDCSDRVMSRNL